jgi:hypothetical protein
MYELDLADSHRMTVTHEYLETQPGARSKVWFLDRTSLTGVVVTDVDTGEAVKVTQERGATFASLAVPIAKPAQSARLRLTGTLTDPAYTVVDGQLAWEQMLRTPRSTIVLPAGWEVTTVSVPATVSTQPDGRVVIQVYDGRPGEGVKVAIRATKRAA